MKATSQNLINKIRKNPDQIFAIFCQKNQDINEPSLNDLFEYGVFAKLGRVLEIPGQGDTITAIIQGLGRCHLDELTKKRPYLVGQVSPAREELPTPNDREYFTAVADLRIRTREYIKENEDIPDESEFAMNNIQNDIRDTGNNKKYERINAVAHSAKYTGENIVCSSTGHSDKYDL